MIFWMPWNRRREPYRRGLVMLGQADLYSRGEVKPVVFDPAPN